MLFRLKQLAHNIHRRLETDEHHLLYLFLELTRRCNLDCRHCGSDCTRDATSAEMTGESWISIIDYIRSVFDPVPAMVVTGGEPLVRKDLPRITEHLGRHSIQWGMVTNGFALDERRLDLLVSHGITSLTVSFDGTRESHTYLRRHPHAFDRVLESMRLIGASSIGTRDAVTCVYPGNLHTLDETAETLIDVGFNSWRLFRIFPRGRAAKDPHLQLSPEESREIVDWIGEHRRRYAKRGLRLSFACEGYLPMRVDRRVRTEPYFCRSGINIASVLCDGTITGCNNNGSDFHQGNVTNDDFRDVWENRFTDLRNRDWAKTGICAECKEWKNCLGGSVHLRKKSKPDPLFCYIARS